MPDRSTYYPWILGLSAFIGILWTWIKATEDGPERSSKANVSIQSRALNTALLSLTGAFIGSRLMYIALHFRGYQSEPEAIIKYWSSGMDWGGAPIGALLFLSPLLYRNRSHILEILGGLTPLWTCICFGAWFAVSSVPVYYSNSVPPAIWSVNLPDLYGVVLPRFPIGFIGMVWTVFADIFARRRNQSPSTPILSFFSVISSQMVLCLIMSFIRSDYVPSIMQIPADRFFALIYLMGCSIAFLLLQRSLSVRKLPARDLKNKLQGR